MNTLLYALCFNYKHPFLAIADALNDCLDSCGGIGECTFEDGHFTCSCLSGYGGNDCRSMFYF